MSAETKIRHLMDAGESGWVARGLSGPTSETLRMLTAAQGWRYLQLKLGKVTSFEDLMARLAKQLDLPDYFGGNWDALDECLGDLVAAETGVVLRLKGADRLEPSLAGPLFDVLCDQVDAGPGPLVVVCDAPIPERVRTRAAAP